MDSLYRPYKKEIQIKAVLFSTAVKMILCDSQFTCAFFHLIWKQFPGPPLQSVNVFCLHCIHYWNVGACRENQNTRTENKAPGRILLSESGLVCCCAGPILVLKAMNVAVCANISEQVHQQPWVVLHLEHHFAGETLSQWSLGDQECSTMSKIGSRSGTGCFYDKSPVKQPLAKKKTMFKSNEVVSKWARNGIFI